MAIARATHTSYVATSGTSTTTSLNLTGTDRLLLVAVASIGNHSPSATWNGSGLSTAHDYFGGQNYSLDFFYMLNPTSGTHDLIVTHGFTPSGSSPSMVVAVEYTGISSTGNPIDTQVGSASSGTTFTKTMTSAVNGLVVAAGLSGNASFPFNSPTPFDHANSATAGLDLGVLDTFPNPTTSTAFTITRGGGLTGYAGHMKSFSPLFGDSTLSLKVGSFSYSR